MPDKLRDNVNEIKCHQLRLPYQGNRGTQLTRSLKKIL